MDANYSERIVHMLIRELRHSPGVSLQRSFGATGDMLIVMYEAETNRFRALRFTGNGEERVTERYGDMVDEELRELVLHLEAAENLKVIEMTKVLSGELDRFLEAIQ